jgi:hypothetical protein
MDLPNAKALARSKHHHSQTKDKNRFKKKPPGAQKQPKPPLQQQQQQPQEEPKQEEEGAENYVPKYIRRALKSNAYRYTEEESVEEDREEWIDVQKILSSAGW